MRPLQVLALTKYGRLGASSRLRSYQYFPWLESAGIEVQAQALIDDHMLARKYQYGGHRPAEIARSYSRRIGAMLRKGSADLVWVEKEALPWFPVHLETALLRSTPYLLDYDDAIFHTYDSHRFSVVRKVFGRRLDKLMEGAATVVAGNQYLASRAAEAGAGCIHLLPTVIDLKRYEPRNDCDVKSDSAPPRVVWIGSPSTLKYLRQIGPALGKLASQFSFVLRVIGGGPIEIPGVRTEIVDWSESTEVAQLSDCRVGIMPLLDSPWERGKCGYKLIQYMACGLPVVASPVGANVGIVDAGRTGLFADSADQWVDKLGELLADKERSIQMGQAGRAKVESMYCIQRTAPRLAEIFHEAASRANSTIGS